MNSFFLFYLSFLLIILTLLNCSLILFWPILFCFVFGYFGAMIVVMFGQLLTLFLYLVRFDVFSVLVFCLFCFVFLLLSAAVDQAWNLKHAGFVL